MLIELLWHQLAKCEATGPTIATLKKLYSMTIYNIHLAGYRCDGIQATRGVRQGCPLSPLFLAYINNLYVRLENSGLYYQIGKYRIPGLLSADDIVLISENPDDLQELLDISTGYGYDFGLSFTVDKSKILLANAPSTVCPTWTLQGKELEVVQQYDYLGVTINGSKSPSSLMIPKLELCCRRLAGLVGKAAFQSYSRYEVVWGLWKGVGVPALTYASDVMYIPNF